MNLLYMIYLHYFPVFLEPLTLLVESFNEIVFLLINYHMVLFSNLVWKPELKTTIGQSMITLVFILLGGNTIVIVMVSVRKILRNKRLKYLKSV